ncbi:S-adenosyl-L-methionine-dependent methyltransferase [Brevibacillus sp. IT-7CA2]|uniref:class I SAM-dependent methyltransferase n=1 Tax=Brevibacillus sp. IT-7CA2 TaxID=3026436 RepID=UPI0039E1386A
MHDKQITAPDHTAVRVALWRALHAQIDSPPHVLEDEIGLRLAAPEEGWRQRPDMEPESTSGFRASIVARARFIEDLVTEQLSQGVTQYLTKDAIVATLRQAATLAPGSTLAMTFLLPFNLTETEERPEVEEAEKGARASGTPFISFFQPPEMLALAREAGFREVQHVSSAELNQRYFTGRTDGLSLPSGEEFLIATI